MTTLHHAPPPVQRSPFASEIRAASAAIRDVGTPAARWLAREIDALAREAEALEAITAEEFEARREVMADAHQVDLYDRGFAAGFMAEPHAYPSL